MYAGKWQSLLNDVCSIEQQMAERGKAGKEGSIHTASSKMMQSSTTTLMTPSRSLPPASPAPPRPHSHPAPSPSSSFQRLANKRAESLAGDDRSAMRRLLLPRPGSLRGASASVWRRAPAYICEEVAAQAVEVDDPPSGAPLRQRRRRIYMLPRLALARRHSCPRPFPPSLKPPQPCVDGRPWVRRLEP